MTTQSAAPGPRPSSTAGVSEGFVEHQGYRTWYRVHGDLTSGAAPLVVVHGGPGFPHDYLTPLTGLAVDGRAVVFYDQLGCGNSDRPDDDNLWTFDTFERELDALVAALGLDRYHLLGHSWGGWLAQQWILDRQPQGLVGLVLASTCSSLPAFRTATRALKEQLPADIQAVLDHHEAEGTTEDPAYFEASLAYITQWMIRCDIPDYVFAAKAAGNEHIADVMQGPEWNVNGRIKDWDVTDRLDRINAPVLVTSGRYDEMTPDVVRPMVEALPNATWELFEHSAHMAHIEETDRYLDTVMRFLRRCDHGRTTS